LQEFFIFPRGFIFGVIIPLNLVKSGSLVAGESVLLIENLGGVCRVCEIWYQWDDVFNINISRRLQTSFELGDKKTHYALLIASTVAPLNKTLAHTYR
jgi:hypothetical protein